LSDVAGSLRDVPRVFISSTTADLGSFRDELTAIFERHGARVDVQKDYPNQHTDGEAIARNILQADVVICLIGYAYGAPLPRENRPAGVPDDCSWTQWEYWCACTRKDREPPRVFIYEHPGLQLDQPPEWRDSQMRFRQRVAAQQMDRFGAGFFFTFRPPPSKPDLATLITKFITQPDGALAAFQAGTWAIARAAYRTATAERWHRSFPDVYRGPAASAAEEDRLMEAAHPPFIASQGFSILVPASGGAQARFLNPAGFLPGRDTEAEARARRDSSWSAVPRDDIVAALRCPEDTTAVLGGVALPRPIRLFLVSGGGVGKTTNMRWLEATLNETAEERRLAVRVQAGELHGKKEGEVLQVMIARIAQEAGAGGDLWGQRAIEAGLREEAAAGRLVILVDGLDHVEARGVLLFTSIQTPGRLWSNCNVVAAGRPQALHGWEDAPANPAETVAAGHWRFLEPAEFEDDEARVFLGSAGGRSRFDLVAEQLGTLRNVPRVVEYVRSLDQESLAGVRTSADIYAKAVRQLIERTLREGGVQTRTCGPNWREDRLLKDPPAAQVDHVVKLLASLAFLSICTTTDLRNTAPSLGYKLTISEDVKDDCLARMTAGDRGRGYTRAALERDLRALSGFAAVIGNGVVDATEEGGEALRTLVWSNRTVHQFLAAYWLAAYARGFDAFSDRLAGRASRYDEESPHRDTDRMRCYRFYPEAPDGDTTYELNLFLAEMPLDRINPTSWVAAASAWYDPDPVTPPGKAGGRLWPAEMLYRSWMTMHDIAGRSCDDWWDLPYDGMARFPAGDERAQASPHAPRQRPQYQAKAARAARTVLARFGGDFAGLLEGRRGAAAQACARELIAEAQWVDVPGGSFRMGSPPERQGFPGKVKAYWIRELDAVRCGSVPARDAARRSTKAEWFTGAQGARLREADIEWLTAQFLPLEPGSGDTGPDRAAQACSDAMAALENRWSRHDETPAEADQQVASFQLHRLPVLHRWFWLFAPGHRATVQQYLGSTPHPPEDHPAIYISWFDAWAFCQWATWQADSGEPGATRRRYGLRLPHEVEWEYATRWSPAGDGPPQQTPFGYRYWWGDRFYEREDEPCEEPRSEDVAHAVGRPGATRAPASAAPNGIGLKDTLGNVWEWMANLYDSRKEADVLLRGFKTMRYSRFFPSERPPVNGQRTMRGGLWYYLDLLANCTARFRLTCDDRDYKMGFRLVREQRPPLPEDSA